MNNPFENVTSENMCVRLDLEISIDGKGFNRLLASMTDSKIF